MRKVLIFQSLSDEYFLFSLMFYTSLRAKLLSMSCYSKMTDRSLKIMEPFTAVDKSVFLTKRNKASGIMSFSQEYSSFKEYVKKFSLNIKCFSNKLYSRGETYLIWQVYYKEGYTGIGVDIPMALGKTLRKLIKRQPKVNQSQSS